MKIRLGLVLTLAFGLGLAGCASGGGGGPDLSGTQLLATGTAWPSCLWDLAKQGSLAGGHVTKKVAAPRSSEGTPVHVLEGARVPRRLSSPQNGEI